ncbi:MAG: class C sortase [Oscillospiraceae bacterium]|nr:class C sortase [Oscillospiraceae bacterium]
MKSKLYNALLALIFLLGLSLLLYPTVSNYYNAVHQTRAIQQYSQEVDQMQAERNRQNLEAAREYNDRLAKEGQFAAYRNMSDSYRNQLYSETGVMCYLEIPAIGVTLPIRHSTSDEVLNVAIGHLEWSSLPVGGESTHCVLSGHRGLPSAELFTNLDNLEYGDTFYIHVLGETLEYWVDQISVVLPNDYDTLSVVEGEDYVTLMTCTPYGINSHRLLVRGTRIHRESALEHAELYLKNEIRSVDLMVVIPVVLVGLSLLVFLAMLLMPSRKKKSRKGRGNHGKP